jgi:PD-(D/E)XK nuclease superfamily protein
MNRRLIEYTEQQLRDAVAQATSWRGVMEALRMHRSNPGTHVKKDVARLGIDVSHFDPRFTKVPQALGDLPFTQPAVVGSASGLSTAAKWFLDRGYQVSIPIEPTAYDLITESDRGLQRVQVKTTNQRSRSGVRLTRTVYDASVAPSARGKYHETPYDADTIDYFFVIVEGDAMYLIPYSVVAGFQRIVVDRKYAAFKIS